jgi:hypothetical protein
LVLNGATWQGGELRMSFREPFSQLRLSNRESHTKESHLNGEEVNFDIWRRKRDSNPRTSRPVNGFQDRRFQPLTHSSVPILPVFVILPATATALPSRTS